LFHQNFHGAGPTLRFNCWIWTPEPPAVFSAVGLTSLILLYYRVTYCIMDSGGFNRHQP
jgi:hypothetical protein